MVQSLVAPSQLTQTLGALAELHVCSSRFQRTPSLAHQSSTTGRLLLVVEVAIGNRKVTLLLAIVLQIKKIR